MLAWLRKFNPPFLLGNDSVSTKHPRGMMYFLSKTVGRLFEPVGFIWAILLIACYRAIRKKDKRQALFTGGLALFISVIGGTKLPAYLLSTLERPYIVKDLSAVPECDAVVVLGGGHSFVSSGTFQIELHGAADRILIAAELVRLGKGQALVTSGGGFWKNGKQLGEGLLVKNWMETWKPFEQPIYDLGINRHTRDEALNAKALAEQYGWKKIALVTSSWHMRRSKALFEKVGLEVVPVGGDLEGTSALENHWTFYPVPWHDGFRSAALYMHEQIGWIYYSLRGWI